MSSVMSSAVLTATVVFPGEVFPASATDIFHHTTFTTNFPGKPTELLSLTLIGNLAPECCFEIPICIFRDSLCIFPLAA